MSDLEAFLASVTPFAALDDDERRTVAARCTVRLLPAGSRLLTQGERNRALYVLRSGEVAVRVRQGGAIETIARVHPPSVLGEVSFITGRTCSAHVDVIADAEIVELQRDALATLPHGCDRVIRGLADVVADRLHSVVTDEGPARATPAVLLECGDRWAAPHAFGLELARALADEDGGESLLVTLTHHPSQPETIQPHARGVARVMVASTDVERDEGYRERLTQWRLRFVAIVIVPENRAGSSNPTLRVTHVCVLLGPHEPEPPTSESTLVGQDARAPSLAALSGTRQLIPDVDDAEAATNAGRAPSAGFRARVASLARAILGQQVGLALGAGGARGWSHVGILDALHRGGVPIDVIAGTSMGAVVGGLWATGATANDLSAAAEEWRRRRMTEWRIWRMHMASEQRLDALFGHYFGARRVNETAVPFWANAVDIENGEELVLRDGLLRLAVRASMAFPGWTPPVSVNGRLLVDGAVMSPAPSALVRAMGARFVVTALAITPMTPRPLASRLPMRAYDVATRAMHLSGIALGQAASEASSDVVIAPDLGDATMLSFDRDRELIATGARTAGEQVSAILGSYARFKARTSRRD